MTVELHFHEASSLKTKRMRVKSIQERLRRRFNVAVAETGYLELWQRAELAVASVGSSAPVLQSQFEAVERELEEYYGEDLVSTHYELVG